MAIRSALGRWFAGSVIWALGMTVLSVVIAFLTDDSKFASVPGNIFLLGAFGGPLSAARCRVQFRWNLLSRQTLQFWILSMAWSTAFLGLDVGAETRYPKPLSSQVVFVIVSAIVLSAIGFIPDCLPRKNIAP